MLASITHLPIVLPPHNTSHLPHSLPQMHNRTLNQQHRSFRRRPKIRAIQRPRNMRSVPESLPCNSTDSHGRAKIEYESDGAAVKIAAAIAERERDRKFEGRVADIWIFGISFAGDEAEVIFYYRVEELYTTTISTYTSVKNDMTYLGPVPHYIFPEEVETVERRVQLDISILV